MVMMASPHIALQQDDAMPILHNSTMMTSPAPSTAPSDSSINSMDSPSTAYFDLMMGVWLPGITCLLGLGGNVLSFLVLSLDRTHCPTFYSLRSLALSDIVLLLSGLLQQVIPMYYESTGCNVSFCRIKGYIRVYSWPIICMAQMSSMWLTVLISAERYMAICFPFQSVRFRRIPKVRAGIITIFASSVIYNIPRFFEFKTTEEFSEQMNMTVVVMGTTDLRQNVVYRYFYNTALYCLILYAVPFAILSFLNIKIIAEMRKASAQWDTLNRKQQRELKATVMPLCVVIVFIICATQSLVAFVLDAIFVDASRRWLQIYFAIVNLIVLLNSAVNFLLFYLFGRKFRFILSRVLTCQRLRSRGSRALSRFDWRNRTMQ